MVKTVGLTVS